MFYSMHIWVVSEDKWCVFCGDSAWEILEILVCSQVRHSECPQGCVPFGFGLRELRTSSCLRLVSRL